MANPPGTLLAVKVAPKAARNAVIGWHAGSLKLCVTAPPEDGRANAAVIALLADVLRTPPSSIHVRRGARSPHKLLAIDGLDEAALLARLPQR